MIRTLVFIAIMAAISLIAAAMADHPGAVALDWLGYHVETSVSLLLASILVVALLLSGIFKIYTGTVTAPRTFRRWREERRRTLGYRALTQGMLAVAAGDAGEARRLARKAEGLLTERPLTMLLTAQAAQLAGDKKEANEVFSAMAVQPEREARFLGLSGMLNQAIQEGKEEEALELAKQANELNPKADAVASALFDLQVKAGEWTDAEGTVKKAVKAKTIDVDEGKRRRAVLAYQQSLEAESEGRMSDALDDAKQSINLSPDFVPGAVRYAQLLSDAGKRRRATGVLEETWVRAPHPALADALGGLTSGGGEERLHAIERLAQYNRDHDESHLALAQAALAASRWSEAREHLEIVAQRHVTARVCRLMAELEEGEKKDSETSRGWLKRAALAEPDAAWVCTNCGNVVQDWEPVCGRCQHFDSFDWTPPPRVTRMNEAQPSDSPAANE